MGFFNNGNLEELYAIEKHEIKTFSEQQLVDCDNTDSGCNGGLMQYAFDYLKKAGCIMTDADYPYKGIKSTCKLDTSKCVDMLVTGFKKLGSSYTIWSPVDEEEVKEFLYENGPLSVALNASPLQSYISGIVDVGSAKCPYEGVNHAALLVGYGTDSARGIDYWIVKNSWGKEWGENGYFRIRRGYGTCGINLFVITATVYFL